LGRSLCSFVAYFDLFALTFDAYFDRWALTFVAYFDRWALTFVAYFDRWALAFDASCIDEQRVSRVLVAPKIARTNYKRAR